MKGPGKGKGARDSPLHKGADDEDSETKELDRQVR